MIENHGMKIVMILFSGKGRHVLLISVPELEQNEAGNLYM